MLLSYMVSSFSSIADINSSAFMMSASMSSISSESLINRKIRIIIADHCMLIKGFSNLVSRATCISAPQFECCWGYPAKSANGQDSPKTLPSWFSAKLNQARIWVSDFLLTDNQSCKNVPTVPTSWCYFFWPVLIFGKSTRKTGENRRKQAKTFENMRKQALFWC